LGTKFKHSLLLLIMLMGTMTTWAQEAIVFGKVISSDKSEIDFATVYLKVQTTDVPPTRKESIT
jgi:hypothetical protein